jgi:hypothetical protein
VVLRSIEVLAVGLATDSMKYLVLVFSESREGGGFSLSVCEAPSHGELNSS